jgi:hypothetical protein
LLRNERRKAKVAGKDDKYRGFSRDEMTMRGGSSYSNSGSNNFSSKRSNFDTNSSYDRDNRFDDELSGGNREVTAFDFGGQKREASPELGFPAESPEHHNNHNDDDDDGFGDFAEARTTKPSTQKSLKNDDGFADFGDFKTSLPSPPASRASIPSPPNSRNSIPAVPPPPGLSSKQPIDLFSSPPRVAKQTHDDFDFLGINTTQPTSAIAPPSGPSSPAIGGNSGTTDIFGGDLFASKPTFNNSASSHMNNSIDFLGGPPPSNNGSSALFDILGSSQPAINTAAPPLQPMPFQQNLMNNQKLDNNFDDLFSKPSTATSSKSSQQLPSSQTSTSAQNKSALWNDLSGSLDLDNLLSTKPKQSLSINELKTKQGMSGSNSFM